MRTRLRWLAVFAAIGLVVAACGSDRGDDDDASPTTTAAPGGDTATTVEEPAGEMFGDLPSPCGEGDASSASFRGVTADTIKIGTGDDRGFASSPGLNQAMGEAVEILAAWCNEQGGINGRQIEVNNYDAAILNLGNVMLSACNDGIFMLVGQGFSLDSAQEETRVGCELGSIPGFSVSPEFAHGPFMMQALPNPTDFAPVQIAAYLGEAYPEQAKKTAVMYANYAATEDTKDKVLATYPPFGFEFLDCPQVYNISGEDDWRPFVQDLIDCQVEILYFTGSPNPNYQNFLVAAQQLGFNPIVSTDANFYEDGFKTWNGQNGGAANNTHVRMAFVPFEEADSVPATAKYLELVEAAGKVPSLLGAQSTASFLLWATAAQACGDALTQECIFEEIAKLDSWNSGGLHAPTNPAENMPPDCGIVMKLEGAEYVRVDPAEVGEFDCSPDYVKPVSGPVVDRAKLGPDRVSTAYLS
jgi:ABC-type branched-subunit amino acid transport system substrate-binding protein